jgi:hypothetical protein
MQILAQNTGSYPKTIYDLQNKDKPTGVQREVYEIIPEIERLLRELKEAIEKDDARKDKDDSKKN